MLGVRELRVEQPARRDLRRLCGDARTGTFDDVAFAALRLDDLLGVEHGSLVGSHGRTRRQDAADLLRTLADDVAVAGIRRQDESVDQPGIAAVRHLDVGKARIEGQLVAALAVVPELQDDGIDLTFGLDELVALRALQLLAPPFAVQDAAGLEVQGVVEEKRVGIAARRKLGMLAVRMR